MHSTKLSASGQELGGELLFDLRYGFSGTPSDLLPLELGSCGYELGSEGNIMTTLTNPTIVRAECKEEWSVRKLLSEVANMSAHALIDTGALITGFTNLEVAQYLLEHGLTHMEGVVFLDRLDRQMILLRSTNTVVPLAQCGIDAAKRFTFYDQVHTTGIDCKQTLNAVAVVTLGKDMTFRDYAQGAFRMRGIGKGQTISLYIIPEVRKLIEAEAKPTKPGQTLIASVAAWLTVNSMRSERLQFMQLCSQNLRNVWRKRAFGAMLSETSRSLNGDCEMVDDRRYFRFQEVHTPDLLHVRRCVNTFREPIDFSIPADITEAKTFAKILADELQQNRDLIQGDETAMKDIAYIDSLATGAMSQSTELQARALNQEMVNEQEQEQEQKKTVEQEEQSQVRFSRDDEQQRSWKIHELARFVSQQASAAPNSARAAVTAASVIATSPTVKEAHPFYEFNRFSVRGVNERDIDLPSHLLLSSNYFRKEWSAIGQRRLKNISIVLEWTPLKHAITGAPAAASSSTAITTVLAPAQLPVSTILSEEQESSLRTAFKLFSQDGSTLSGSDLKLMMREVGEDLSLDELTSLGSVGAVDSTSSSSGPTLSYADFKQFILSRSVTRTDTQGRKYFVAVSLKEAESLRRLIHTQHPLFGQPTDGPDKDQVAIGLRLINGALLDASNAFKPASDSQQSLALQSMRFIDCQCFYNDAQISSLLKSLQNNRPVRRQAFFENLLRCRRRDRRRYNDTPLNSIFLLRDEHNLLSYRAKVAKVRFCLRNLTLTLQDAFMKFDTSGNGHLSTTELAFALIEYLKLPLSMPDIAQLMEFANKKGDGLLSLEEFGELLREPEIVSQTLKEQDIDYMEDVPKQANMVCDDASCSLSPDGGPASLVLKRNVSYQRLTLTPEYEQLYAAEEAMRLKKQHEVEQELELAKAEKIAREIERKEIEESQARDWKQIQEMRKMMAMEERWTCVMCTFKNEPTAHFCTVCESKRPADSDRKQVDLHDIEDSGDANDGPAFWQCATCSYNNDQSATVCEICNAMKPKVQRAQKKIVSLWSCPICTRLVTSDKQVCDVCTSDKEAIRTAAAEPTTHTAKDVASLFGNSLIGRDGMPVNASELAGKTVGLYFSASWCGPCRAFTPQLAPIYEGAKAANLPFEIVFVSADKDVEEFNEYFRSMPWKAVKYSDTPLRNQLSTQFGVSGIPTLIILDPRANVLTATGRADIATVGDAAIAAWCNQSSESSSSDASN